ncbi:MAG TPA: hypothetical protein ENI33_08440 [Thermoplasmatales archaeon]|nr:hypothetical protein [Thermoplasmatales archaeon]
MYFPTNFVDIDTNMWKSSYTNAIPVKENLSKNGFENMTYPKEVILTILHLYVEELSLSKIRNFIPKLASKF